jgi:multisubunit Na+/H+ antiporter MnhF subunit
MRQEFLIAAAVLLLGMAALVPVSMRGHAIDGLVALEIGGAMTTLAVVCVAVGTQSSSATGVALITAVLCCAELGGRAAGLLFMAGLYGLVSSPNYNGGPGGWGSGDGAVFLRAAARVFLGWGPSRVPR